MPKFFLPFIPNSKGFTLIEILVAIAIIGLIGVVAIPNYRKFQEDQQVTTDSGNLVQALKLAQSNALTSVQSPQCSPPSFSVTVGWDVLVTQTDFTIYPVCGTNLADPGTTSSNNYSQGAVQNSTTEKITTPCVASPYKYEVLFTASNGQPIINTQCNGGGFTLFNSATPVELDVIYNTTTKVISINRGGGISLN